MRSRATVEFRFTSAWSRQPRPRKYSSASPGLDDVRSTTRSYDACELELSGFKQFPKLSLCSFTAARGYRQHRHVKKVSYRALRGGLLGKYHIDDQQPRRRAHDAMAVSQYRPCAFVVPIVDNVLEDISVSPGGYRFKEVAADDLATV